MSLRKFLGCVLSVAMFATTPALSAAPQEAKATPPAGATASDQVPEGGTPRYIRPETPEQRRDRLGTQEDPGINPDPDTVWIRFGKKYKIAKFDKRWAKAVDQPGFIKPLAFVNFIEEIYQENDKYVWVWIEELELPDPDEEGAEPEEPEGAFRRLDQSQIEYLEHIRGEFTPLDLPKANVKVRFEKASEGLPVDGSWRSSLAVADMNGDGHMDIVLPPERAGRVIPSIFAGDGKGNWKFWKTNWPKRLNYGSVVAADFNKDKKMDLAFGIHLDGIAIFLGDGKGNFREVSREMEFPTRRIITEDVNGDGWQDVVAISEGPLARGKNVMGKGYGNLRAYLNPKNDQPWESINISQPGQRVSGDWLATGDFNGDRAPDFVGSNIYFNGTELLYVSKGRNEYEPVAPGEFGDTIPFRSYYWGVAAGPFSSDDRDDAIITYQRRWVARVNPKLVPPPPLERVVGLDRITWVDGQPQRVPIARWGGKATSIIGIDSGDVDRDGKTDLLFTRRDRQNFQLLVGDGKGGFRDAEVEGLELGPQRHYDLQLVDVNGDRRLDVVIMYEAQSGTSFSRKNGRVEVFLNRGTEKTE